MLIVTHTSCIVLTRQLHRDLEICSGRSGEGSRSSIEERVQAHRHRAGVRYVAHASACSARTHRCVSVCPANEREVGEGIKRSGVPREEIFLTTKLNNTEHADPLAGLEKSLAALETPYLDLWLMHWPCPMKNGAPDRSLNWLDTWRGMEAVFRAHPDKVRAIGVSNVSVPYLHELLKIATVVPAVNQIESHPSLAQEELVQLCRSKGIAITAYSPLGSDNAPLGGNPVVKEIAQKHGVTPHNILVSFHANRPGVNGAKFLSFVFGFEVDEVGGQ